MKALLEFLTWFLRVCTFGTFAAGFYYNWMYRRHWRSDRFSDPRPGDSLLAVFRRNFSNETRAYGRKALIALVLLCALIGLKVITDDALRGITAPGG